VEVDLAKPRGFCFGVERALKIVDRELLKNKPENIFVYNELVHNTKIIEDYKLRGVHFVFNLDQVPNSDEVTLVFSAHGISPTIKAQAKTKNYKVLDSTCPIVSKVHNSAAKLSVEGYHIIIIGDKYHDEIKGLIGEIENYSIVKSLEEVETLRLSGTCLKIAYLTQTTLNVDDTMEIVQALKKKFPNIIAPGTDCICDATKLRQDAIKQLKFIIGQSVDLVLICGSPNSSNSNKLVSVAKEYLGVDAFLIDNVAELQDLDLSKYNRVVLSSGASVPEESVQEIYKALK
jgi:4-hydroxy-3-methylbut-2-enyl diphosphate reductase